MKEMTFSELHFRYPFRKYQQMVLEMVTQRPAGKTNYHIVAPPGSGKTIIGLELIRHFGRPAVVFAPTTTIQQQWQEKAGLFTTDADWLARQTSTEAGRLAAITVLTYQVLSTPGENLAFVERVAVERWVEDLLRSGQATTEAEARQRLATLQAANPRAARQEISKRYRRVKRDLLQQGDIDGRQFLHPNARDLIARIAALGVGTIILDECHHLLDYWAFILRELIKSLPGVRVIGLTATLPDPGNEREYENYHSLLGEVDFEVPTPAVVKEGNLAPYRDLVYFCEPSPREIRYLQQIQTHFEKAVARVTATPTFQTWIERTILGRAEPFEEFLNREPLLGVAGVKYLLARQQPLPDNLPVIEEMLQPLAVDDWLTLLETFGLQALKVSSSRQDQALYRELREALLGFGITISEGGIRHQRSPGDLVLALSEAKDWATVEILAAERAHLGERLRAVVITDFERLSARTRRLHGVLDPDAGSAVRVFRHLIAAEVTNALDPVLVTGSVVLVDADNRERLEAGIRAWLAEKRVRFSWAWQPTEDERVLQLTGSGRDWGSRTYVALLTDLFEQGVTQCLVGTRGIFGEGWDALRLNTLIDLTSVTTSTGVQQLRGRTIRLDPNWPGKVAHNWEVVCYTTRFDRGDMDVGRFVARHAHTWGLVVRSGWEELGEGVSLAMAGLTPGMSMNGRVVRGVAHVDLDLATDLATRPFKRIKFEKYTQRMIRAVGQRDKIRELWQIGGPYENFIYSATQIRPEDIKFQTVYRVRESLRSMVWRLVVSVITVAVAVWLYGGNFIIQLGEIPEDWLGGGLLGVLVLGTVAAVGLNVRQMWRVFRRAFLEMPADDVLLDLGRALLAALRQAGLVSAHLNENYVRVAITEDGGFQVFLDYASPEDSDTFAQAYRQLLGPLGDARYLIQRDSGSMRHPLYRLLWVAVRTALNLKDASVAYHRVPDILATRKERAEALAAHWRRFVGGGKLIYTRSAEGRRILLNARSRQRGQIRQLPFALWK